MGTSKYKLDDNSVRSVIDYALNWSMGELGKTSVDVEVLRKGWLALKAERRKLQQAQSFELGAAEHYLYAAFAAALSGDPVMQLAAPVYELKKKAYFSIGWEKKMRVDPNVPALPPHDGVVDWGIEGARYGLGVYKKLNPGKQFQYGASIEHLMKDAGYSDEATIFGGEAAKKFGALIAPYI